MSPCSCALARLSSANRLRSGRSTNTATAAAAMARPTTPSTRARNADSGTAARPLDRRCGRRLIRIMSLVPRRAHRQPDADQRLGGMRAEIAPIERAVDLDLAPGIGDLEWQPRPVLDRAVQRADLRAATRQDDARDVGVGGGRQEEVE